MSTPRVSVLLPVYNGAEYLNESIQSVLGQTFADFELLVIDDASTDGSAAIAERTGDARIRIIRQESNRGLPDTLNHGLDLAGGEYVARMDADDRCLFKRLERQVGFMDSNPEIGISGGWIRLMGGWKAKVGKYPVSPNAVETFSHFHCPFAHPTVILRRSLLEEYRLRYDHRAVAVEDFELWTRLLRLTRGANIPEILLEYRLHETSVTTRNWKTMDAGSVQVLRKVLQRHFPNITDEMARYHRRVCMAEIPPDIENLNKAGDWLCKLSPALDLNHEARQVLREVWVRIAMQVVSSVGMHALRPALAGTFPGQYGLNIKQRLVLTGSAFKASIKRHR
jgi:glycosyltransferase involved in cell wall biosynthesis